MSEKIPDLSKEILIFDGAMGTMLQDSGYLPPGAAPELLNLTHPEAITNIHNAYLVAGAGCIETNTFGGNRLKLESFGLADRVKDLNTAGVKLAKAAAGGQTLVAASIGPTGKMLEPLGDLSFETAYQIFLEQAQILAAAGANLIIIETMSDLIELKAAILAALSVKLPVIAAVSFMENGRLLTGTTPEMVAASLSGFPLLALGTNCGLAAKVMQPLVQRLSVYAKVPLIAQPNAGKPGLEEGRTIYNETPQEFASSCLELIRSGARIIGGCCGTTPEHIRLLKIALADIPISAQGLPVDDYLVAKNSILPVSKGLPTQAIAEVSLDPTNQVWMEFQNGDCEPFIDFILSLNPDEIREIRLDGLDLAASQLDSWRLLLQTSFMYWPNLITAKLNVPSLAREMLINIPGRSLIYGDAQNKLLGKVVIEYGGVFQKLS